MKCSPNNNALDCKDNKALIKYELARYILTYLKRLINKIRIHIPFNRGIMISKLIISIIGKTSILLLIFFSSTSHVEFKKEGLNLLQRN